MQGGYGPVLGQINSECKDPSTLWVAYGIGAGGFGNAQCAAGMRNAIANKRQKTINEAREYVADHPHNPGILDRFMDSRSGKGPAGADVTAWGRAGYVMGWHHANL